MRKISINAILFVLLFIIIGSITFFQYTSYRNSKILLSSNDELLKEINYKNYFQKLQTHIITLDKLVREFILTKGAVRDEDIKAEIAIIDSTLDFIEVNMPDIGTSTLKAELDSIVDNQINQGIDLLNEFNNKGRHHAEQMVSAHGKLRTNIEIKRKLDALEQASEQIVKRRARQIERYETRSIISNIYFSVIVCFLLVLALFYIYIINRHQHQLILKLKLSKESEQRLARAKDEFLAHMSHEIRTPLNAILGFISLLEKENHTPASREMIATIKDSGSQLLTIVNEILELSKLEEGMLRISTHAFNLHEVITKTDRAFRERIEAKGIRFEIIHSIVNPLWILGDEYRLTQILHNLLGNALKFTEHGGITLQVEINTLSPQHCEVHFIISDTGIGIAANKIQTVFERFEQGDSQITRKYGGTGLGLYIVKQLVELQNGRISVQSEPGKGSAFTVTLRYELADENSVTTAGMHADNTQHEWKDMRVLIVEDNPINQKLLTHWFSNRGIAYTLANHGKEAIEQLTHTTVDLILMDVQMPEMDGYQCTALIRNELHLDTPIIAMTAHALASEIAKCYEAGMNDHIIKPIDERALMALLEKYSEPRTYALIDQHYLETLANGDVHFMKELLSQFMEQSAVEFASIEQAFDAADLDLLHRSAHSLKTSIGYLGLQKQHLALLEELEQSTDRLQAETIRSAVVGLYEGVRKECKHLLNHL